MAEQDESSMIGYDPLAWLHETEDSDLPSRSKPDTSLFLQDQVANSDESVNVNSQVAHVAEASGESIPTPDMDDLTAIVNEKVDNQSAEAATQCQLVLAPVQNIQIVAQLHQDLQRMLNHCNKIDIDASAVTQIDTAAMQLLLVFKLTAVKLQKEVSIDFPSERFLDAANLLGLSEMLGVDQVASGFF